MTRKWIGQTAVRLYPADVRAAKGEELVGTLLDAGDHSRAAFIGQLMSLIVAGLVARSRDVHSQPLDQLAFDVIRWAAVITVGRVMSGVVMAQVRWGGSIGWAPKTIWVAYLAPALILAMFISRRDRAAGVTGLAWCLVEALDSPQLPVRGWIELLVLPLVGFGLMTIAPRRHHDAGRTLVLIPVLAWAFFKWTELGLHSGVGYLLPVLAAAVFVTIKPALALGTALAWSFLAAWYLTIPGGNGALMSAELLSCAPIALILAGLSRRALARP